MYYFLTFGFAAIAHSFLILPGLRDRAYKYVATFLAFGFSILCAFRFIGVGWDSFGGIDAHSYKKIYESVSGHTFFETFEAQPWEFGFSLIFWIFSKANISFELFQLLIYMFFYYTILEVSRRYVKGWAAFVFSLCASLCVVDSFNLLRTYVALFIGIWSLFYFVNGREKTAWLVALVAVTIHVSAFSFLIIYLFSFLYSRSKALYWLALGGAIAFSVLVSQYALGVLLSGTRVEVYLAADEHLFAMGTYLVTVIYWLLISYLVLIKGYKDRFVELVYPSLLSILIIAPVHYVHYMAYRMLFAYIFILFVLIAISLYRLAPNNARLKVYSLFSTVCVLVYPLYRVSNFVLRERDGQLSAQLYMFDWVRFFGVFSAL